MYRAALPTEINVPFLETLKLRTVVLLEHVVGTEEVDPMFSAFLEDSSIELVRIGEEGSPASQALGTSAKAPMSEDLVLRAMHAVVDSIKYPLMVSKG